MQLKQVDARAPKNTCSTWLVQSFFSTSRNRRRTARGKVAGDQQVSNYQKFVEDLESVKQISQKGTEFWWGRDVVRFLNYKSWENFDAIVKKAVTACENSGQPPLHHFHAVMKMVDIGSGAKRGRADWALTRYACYLIAMNGDTSKPEVAHAQTYFAVQTRKQELRQELEGARQRLELRGRMANSPWQKSRRRRYAPRSRLLNAWPHQEHSTALSAKLSGSGA